MTKLGIVEEAMIYAAKMHGGQMRKGSHLPYIIHPMETAAIVATMTTSQEVIAAAMLHDILEDTSATAEEVESLFGPEVCHLVSSESEDKRPNLPKAETWLIRKEETLARLKDESESAMMIALADKLSNLRSLQRDLPILGEGLWQRFNQKDKNMHAWYYRSIAQCLAPLSGYEAYKEYVYLLDEVFG